MTGRLLGLAALLIALAGAVWAGAAARRHVDGPGPIAIVRTATKAYAAGDCELLRDVSEHPKVVECAQVREVQAAYRSEGLEPSEFSYRLVSRDNDSAVVRVSYLKGGNTLDALIPVEKHHGDWEVADSVQQLD